MPSYARWLYCFAVFLFVAGLVAFAASGFTSKAKTAIMMGSLTGGIMATLGWLSTKPRLAKGAVATAIGFSLFFGSTFIWRGAIAWQNMETKLYLAILLSVMALASLATVAALLVMWPKPPKEAMA